MKWIFLYCCSIGLAAAFLGCDIDNREPGTKAQSPEVFERDTVNRRYHVVFRTVPAPPPKGDLFEVEAIITLRDGTPVENGMVKINASMPHHGHGMATQPIDDPGDCDDDGLCLHPKGVYKTAGFKFHMGGAWTVSVDIEKGPLGPDRTTFVVNL